MSLPDDPVATTTGDLDALRRRMSTDDRFRYRRHDLFTTVFTTPLTVDMVLGEQAEQKAHAQTHPSIAQALRSSWPGVGLVAVLPC